jgi:hypothetical protein
MTRRTEALVKLTLLGLVCALWTVVIVACGNEQPADAPENPANDPEPTKEPPPPEPTKEPPPPPEPAKADGGGSSAQADGGGAPAADGGATEVACGRPGQPMCPLQEYMKKIMNPAMRSGEGIEESFTRVAGWAPDPSWDEGENGWRRTAEAGAAAIRASNKLGAQNACKACHKAWQKRYKTEFRPRPLPQ